MPAGKLSKTSGKNQTAHPLEGAKAPSFELADASGKSVALRDLLSRGNLVLYFYPRDMTPGCTTEACNFRDEIGPIRALGAEVAGISGDSTTSHQKFVAAHSLNFPLLSDPGNAVARAYGVYKKKSLYGREYMGVERTTFLIDGKGVVRKVFAKVKVNGHSAAVIEALRAMK
jgi:peroxiredoxin Q/BCP